MRTFLTTTRAMFKIHTRFKSVDVMAPRFLSFRSVYDIVLYFTIDRVYRYLIILRLFPTARAGGDVTFKYNANRERPSSRKFNS